ncbi:hypothetical protein Tco_1016984 [Tanacetum coccineum]|uniref:Uncharacterized protein n=1 Tax=Tanacetum coccineum TaxID=301880 RepID=A0ABQ5FQR0_9ASTR
MESKRGGDVAGCGDDIGVVEVTSDNGGDEMMVEMMVEMRWFRRSCRRNLAGIWPEKGSDVGEGRREEVGASHGGDDAGCGDDVGVVEVTRVVVVVELVVVVGDDDDVVEVMVTGWCGAWRGGDGVVTTGVMR